MIRLAGFVTCDEPGCEAQTGLYIGLAVHLTPSPSGHGYARVDAYPTEMPDGWTTWFSEHRCPSHAVLR